MDNKFSATIADLLDTAKLDVPESYIRQFIGAHPFPQSLQCVADLMDSLSLQHTAAEVEKDTFDVLPTPFLAHTIDPSGNSNLVLVKNTKKFEKSNPDFKEKWTGNVLLADYTRVDHFRLRPFKVRENIFAVVISSLLLSFTAACIYILLTAFSITTVVFMITCGFGLLLSLGMVDKSIRGSNGVTDRLCGLFSKDGCAHIMQENGSNIFPGIGLPDLAATFFIIEFLLAVIASASAPLFAYPPFVLTVVIGSVCCLISFSYQLVAQRFCSVCNGIIMILAVQLAVICASNGLGYFFDFFEWHYMLLTGLISAFGLFVSMILKGYASLEREMDKKGATLMKFQTNPQLIKNYLFNHNSLKPSPIDNEIIIGDRNAPIQLIMVCAPFCQPCRVAHEVIDQVTKNDKYNLAVRIRFAHFKDDDVYTKEAVTHLMSLLLNDHHATDERARHIHGRYIHVVLAQWFKTMDLTAFAKHFPLVGEVNISKDLAQQKEWSKQMNITHTPTIFVNGFKIRQPYTFMDLQHIIAALDSVPKQEKELQIP